MKAYSSIIDLKNHLASLKEKSLTLGFVPTMGALHQGHISLIEKASQENDIVICSIFVNPIQFNNKEDFEKYPIQSERDKEILKNAGCDIVFMPTAAEMYPEPPKHVYDFGRLDKVMEGAFREGHFNGVAIVVKRLFDIVRPDKAYFGEKDFQQLQIIRQMVKSEHMFIEIVSCPIIREADGLAMSSRNMRLTEEERALAPSIYRTLKICTQEMKGKNVTEIKAFFVSEMSKFPEFRLDYFEIAEEITLQPIKSLNESKNPRAFVAVFLGNIRLIDNMKIIL
ncbi:MAG: pantoate--beta-alanine ligase [Bacteroidota bacterium]